MVNHRQIYQLVPHYLGMGYLVWYFLGFDYLGSEKVVGSDFDYIPVILGGGLLK